MKGSQNAGVFQGILQDGLLDSGKDQTDVGGISGLGETDGLLAITGDDCFAVTY
jgi:hypothetical protein